MKMTKLLEVICSLGVIGNEPDVRGRDSKHSPWPLANPQTINGKFFGAYNLLLELAN